MSWMASLRKSINRWWKGPPKPINPSIDPDPERCLNCGIDLSPSDNYCPSCGQRNRQHKLTLKDLLFETAVNFFGYDSKLWYTLKHIGIPGRTPKLFQEGKRASLVHPTRLFFFSFLILALVSKADFDEFNIGFSEGSGVQIDLTPPDSVRQEAVRVSDSLDMDALVGPESELDSLAKEQLKELGDSVSLFVYGSDSIETVKVSRDLIKDTPQDSIFKVIGLSNTWRNKFARQQVKFLKDREAYGRFLTGTLIWMLLLLQPFVALALKIILYRWYYSDHLVWSVYTFSTFFLFGIVLQLGRLTAGIIGIDVSPESLLVLFMAFLGIYGLTSIKKFYDKSYTRSFFIFFYLSISAVMVLVLVFLLNLAVSFFLF